MRFPGRFTLSAVLFCALTLGVAAQTQPLKVVASFSILADVVQNVAGDHAVVTSLIPVGADPHGFEPSAREIAALAQSDVIFVTGANFEEGLLRAIENVGADTAIVEASACVPMRVFAGVESSTEHDEHDGETHTHQDRFGLDLETRCGEYETLLSAREAADAPSIRAGNAGTVGPLFEAACAGHEDAHGGDGDSEHHHEAASCDPHVWSDPHSVELWTLYIRDTLSAVDPANAAGYAANADAYLKALDDLVRLNLEPQLAAIPADRRVLLTNHETLGYFAAAYGFEVVGFVLPGGSALAETSAQDLAALIVMVRSQHIPAIFTESTLSSGVANQVAAETGVEIFTLYTDSLGGTDSAASTYLDYLTYNVETIAAALSQP